MRKLALLALPIFALSATACSDDSTTATAEDLSGLDLTAVVQDFSGTQPDLSGGDMGPPAAPTLGAQIDRFGRPGVNTALTDPFWDDGTQTAAGHHAKQDAYNALSDPTAWATSTVGAGTVSADIAGALAAYDALSGTGTGLAGTNLNDGCGDQLAFGALTHVGYITLTSVLADDQLYVNTTSGACTTYLAAEAGVLGVTNTDCGGRTPNYNTIDITYSALAAGSLVTGGNITCLNGTATCGVSNGVLVDPDANVASASTFPFLGAAN